MPRQGAVAAWDTMTRLTITLISCAVFVSGSADAPQRATADIRDAQGKKVGDAILEQRDGAHFNPTGKHGQGRLARGKRRQATGLRCDPSLSPEKGG